MKANFLTPTRLVCALITLLGSYVASAGDCSPPPGGIVSWWRGENNALDAMSGNNGVLQNGASFSAGEDGQAFSFNGINSYVAIPKAPNLDVSNQVTIEFWMRADPTNAMNSYQGLVTSDFYGIEIANGYVLGPLGVNFFISTDGGASVSPSSYPDTATVNGGGAVVSAGVWHHIAGTYDGAKLQLYVDGQPWGNPNYHTGAISPMLANSFVAIGSEDGRTICPDCVSNRYFNGQIDEPSIYNRALSASEILAIYNAGAAGKCVPTVTATNCATPSAGLVAWWPAEENANDLIGTNNGTLQGGATFSPGKVAQGFRFDGTNGYVQVPDSDVLKPTNVTCEAWVWLDPNVPANRGGEQIVFKKNTWSAWFEGYSLLKVTIDNGDGTYSDRFQFCVSRYGNQVAINSQTIAQRGVWYHVAATYDGNQSTLYVNGVAEASATPGFALDYDTTPIFIGTSGTWPPYLSMFAGIIDELSIYNRALSQSEIQAIYNAGAAGKCAPASEPCSTYANFNSTAGLNLIGSAAVTNGVLRLTPAMDSQTGDAWLTTKQPCAAGFDTSFHFQITQLGNIYGNEPGGDGFTFAIQNLSPTNLSWAMGDTNQYVAVFFNTFWNWPGCTCPDVSDNSVGILVNQTYIAQTDLNPLGINMSDGAVHQAQVHFDGASLNVWVDNVLVLTNVPFAGLQPGADASGSSWVGFTAGTGAAYENHDILDWSFCLSNNVSTTTNCVSAPSDLVAWWPAEGNGTDVINGNTATLMPGVGYAPGEVGQGFLLNNSSNAYLTVSSSPTLNVGANGGLTVEAWINLNNVDAFHPIVEWNDAAGNIGVHLWLGLYPWDSGALYANVVDTAGNSHTLHSAQNVLVTNSYEHVALTYDQASGVGTLYVNGAVVAQSNLGSFTAQTSYELWLGHRPGDVPGDWTYGSYLSGVRDELAIYKRALSQGEIQSIYNAGSAGKCLPTPPAIPSISNINPASGVIGNVITITGANFSNVASNNIVYFGSVRATVLTASSTALTVIVPPGAIYAPVTVTVNGLVAYADKSFQPEFTGAGSNITSSSFAPGFTMPSGYEAGSAVIADLDGDGKPDIAVVNANPQMVSIYRNLGAGGALSAASFAPRVDLPLPAGVNGGDPYRLHTADLDGDGRLDLIASEVYGSRVSILRNISTTGNIDTNSFEAPLNISVGADSRFSIAADLDGDGRADIVALNFGDSTISILKNIGTSGGISSNSFAPPMTLIPAGSPYEVAIGDLDGDGKPDLAVANYSVPMISVFRNTTAAGILNSNSFARVDFPSTQTHGTAIAIGDLDGDGRPDIIAGFVESQTVSVFRNVSSQGLLDTNSFAAPVDFSTPGWMHSIALADFNGDGKLDVAVCGELASYMSIFQNISSPGSFTSSSFAPRVDFSTGWNAWGVAADDLDGDGRPDVVFCNAYDSNIEIYQNVFSFTNTPPQITNPGGQSVSYAAPPLPVPFTVFDAETPASNLVVTASSSNTNLVPNEQLSLGGTDTNRTVTPTPITNTLGATTITLTVTDPGGLSNQVSFPFTVINNSPQVSSIASIRMVPNSMTAPIDFTISDNETPADQLIVTANSFNPAVIPTNNIALGGSGANRTVTITSLQPGIANIVINVTDTLGGTGGASFQVTVTNLPPQFSGIAAQRAPLNSTIGPIAFTLSDDQTPADQIVVTASSSNPSVVSTNQIIFGGNGTNRTVTIVPGTNVAGVVTIILTATDNLGASSSTSFSVTLDQFTQLAPGLPFFSYSAVAWGDFDNDGQLDLLVSGTTNRLASGAVTRIYHNNGGVFTNTPFLSLTNLYKSAVAWVDYDRDGKLDVTVSGINSSNAVATVLYHNNGDGTFTQVNAGFAGAYSGTLAWGDFDNDGAPDLFLSGLVIVSSNSIYSANTTNISKLYRNNGDGTFTDMNLNLRTPVDNRLAGPNNGTAAWADFDNDGKQDLLLVGSINNIAGITSVYRNLGNGVFSNVFSSQIASYYGGAGAWGDFDNDGHLDVAISGALNSTAIYRNDGKAFTLKTTVASGPTPSVAWGDFNNDGFPDLLVGTGNSSTLYRNNAGASFTSAGISLPPISNGSMAWGDFNNDGNLDIVFASGSPAGGGSTTLYRNNNNVTNTRPALPFDLLATTTPSNNVVLTWQAPADAQTISNGLSYNIRVGTAPGGVDVVSPLADPTNGTRRVAALGNVGPTNRALLIDLPKGTYYWSVQAIDAAFAGSPFAWNVATFPGDYKFTITNSRPTISPIPDQFIAPLTSLTIPFTIGDAETSASNLVVAARTSNTNIIALTNIVFGGFGSNRTVRITSRTNGVATVTITVTDAQGAFGLANLVVTATPFTLVSSNFVQVENSTVAWGDYNNDGRLDVFISGISVSNFSTIVTGKLYRNDGNGVFTAVSNGLPNVAYGSATWGDFDNDGYLDLLVTGTTNYGISGAISRVYHNNGDSSFTDIGAGLPGVYYSAVACGDFDNDGRLDFILTGTTNGATSGAIAQIYHNNGDGTFSNSFWLPGIFQGSVAVADFDGDGRLDIALAGINQNGSYVAWIYRNNGGGAFTLATSLTGVAFCAVTAGDFDNDGRPDLLISGYNGSYLTTIYRNNGNFNFGNIGANLPGARYTSAAWGDFDNDGRPDILLSGTSNGSGLGGFARIYRNTGSTIFSQAFSNYTTSLPTNYSGTVTWADFDNNGTLDILLTGTDGTYVGQNYSRSQTMLFRNNSGVSNTPPTAPAALTFKRGATNLMTLTWAKSTDAQTTNSNGLKYQIRVGTSPGGIQIESPASDLSAGYRRLVQAGDASTNHWQLQLPPGTYFWSVQAIDTAFAGSPFATESLLVVPTNQPPIAVDDSLPTPTNTPAIFSVAKLLANDSDPDGDIISVVSVSSSSTQSGTVSLASGQVTYSPPTNFFGTDTFTYTIADGQGGSASGSVTVSVGSVPISLNIVSGPAMSGGNFVVSFTGIPGLTYTIEAASNLSGPWEKVANITAPTTDQGQGVGVFQFTEPANGNATRFYRTIYPAY